MPITDDKNVGQLFGARTYKEYAKTAEQAYFQKDESICPAELPKGAPFRVVLLTFVVGFVIME